MPIARFQLEDGRIARFEVPEGTTPEQAQALMAQHMASNPPDAKQEEAQDDVALFNPNLSLEDRARQIGRNLAQVGAAGVEGAAELGDVAISPITQLLRVAGIDTTPMAETVRRGASAVGVPEASGKAERVMAGVGKVAGPTLATMGTGALMTGAQNAVTRGVGGLLTNAPGQQLAAATTSAAAGETAKESGASPATQVLSSLAGSLSVPAVTGAYNKLASLSRGATNTLTGSKQVDAAIDQVLRRNQIDTSGMTVAARNELRMQVAKALDAGGLDDAAVRRAADYATVGATPTRGTLTLDPGQITRERNLAKLGVNTGDETLQRLGQIQRQNDMTLTGRLNTLGASDAADDVKAGESIMASLRRVDEPRKAAVDSAYRAVRDSQGRYANLDHVAFVGAANNALDEKMLGSALPGQARTLLNDVAQGKIPLNVNTMAQIDKRLSGQMRDAFAAGNSEAALAIRQIRDALEAAPLESGAGEQARNLYQQARAMAAERFRTIERTPALKAALDGDAPDKFVQTYIIGSGGKANVRDVVSLAEQLSADKSAMEQARNQIALFLKSKALSGNADEVGNFSPSAYNRALQSIGNSKLGMFFSKDEMAQLRAVGRVASYEKFQPTGSAVNNSNTAGMMMGKVLDIAGKVPFGRSAIVEPVNSIIRDRQALMAMNPTLATGGSKSYSVKPLLLPAVYGTGLLSP